ncbi:MAG: Phage-related protein [Xylanivirga thermophila]|jgi:phage minor structural protein|uniref:phage tail spike protein n=1 Tax=Xylanivirga thermophila TaxID=2496273 RepID=UPI0039F49E0F
MITIYDKKTSKGNFENNGLCVLDECIMAEIAQELNGEYSLEIEYPVVSHKAQYLEELNIIKADGQLFRIYKVERIQDKISKIKVWARHIFYDLAYYFIESVRILNANTKEALEGTIPPEVQAVYDFTAPERNIAPFIAKEINAADAMYRLIEVYGGEIYRDNYRAHIKDKVGTDKGILIKYGKNIRGMKVIEDTSEMATKIYPIGANGLLLPERYIEVSEDKANILPFPIVKKVEFKECKDVDTLRVKAKEYAEKVSLPKIFITIDFLELSKIEEYKDFKCLTEVDVGDIVKVRNERLGFTTELRVIKKKVDLINPINTKIELGDPLNTIIEKIDTSKLLDEINNAITGTLSSIIIKKNTEIINITTSKYAAMVFGITAKADTNLNCNITMTGKASEDCSIKILFSLDGVYYDFKPIQKLAKGDNVIGLPLPMPQVTAGDHTFMVELEVTNGSFVIEKGNLQVTIEGRDLEGGLSASIPRAEVIYSFLYNLFHIKFSSFKHKEDYYFISLTPQKKVLGMIYTEDKFNSIFNAYRRNMDLNIDIEVVGIIEEFSPDNSNKYLYDNEWVVWSADFDKNKDGTYDYYSKVSISEPELIEEGAFDSRLEKGVLYTATLPNRNLYNNLLSISWELEEI